MWVFSSVISLLADNLIFTKALGTSTLMAATKNKSNLVILSLMMTCFSVLGSLMTWLVYWCFPQLVSSLFFLQPLLYTAVISVIYIIVLLLLYGICGRHFAALKKYVHLSAFNCAVMGTLYQGFSSDVFTNNAVIPTEFLGIQLYSFDRLSPVGAALFGLQMGLGFVLASLLLLAVRGRLYAQEVPAAFRGFPAVMIYIGLLSMAVYAITV